MKIIIKAYAGSHLFGTATENSDTDYKGVFIPSAEQILLGSYPDTVRQSTGDHNQKNSKEDVDCELYSLKKFLAMLENGDTAALELLFTPDNMIFERTEEWDTILEMKELFLSKKVNALIGYARQQSNRYGVIGSRMGELNKVLTILKEEEKSHSFVNPKLRHSWDNLIIKFKDFKYVNLIELPKSETEKNPAFDILGKKFSHDTPFAVINKCLSDYYKTYGQRAREAKKNNGVDFKAISHCCRVMLQGIEFMQTGNITLPHTGSNLDLILNIKLGKMKWIDIEPIIEELFVKLEAEAKKSTLPDKVNREHLNKVLYDFHKKEVLK